MLSCKRCAAATPVLRRLGRSFAASPAALHQQQIEAPLSIPQAQHNESYSPQLATDETARLQSSPNTTDPPSQQQNNGVPSRRQFKRRRSSPANLLTASLQAAGNAHAVPLARESMNKLDISYFNPMTADDSRLEAERRRERMQTGRRTTQPRLGLQTVVASYISWKDSGSSTPFVPTEAQAELLRKRNYNVNDVEDWAAILSGKDSTLQAAKMLAHTDEAGYSRGADQRKPLPTFVFLYFLRRSGLPASALRHLLTYAWWTLRHRNGHTSDYARLYPSVNAQSFFIGIIRLIRHARICLPEALFSIARLFVRFSAATSDSSDTQNLVVQRKRLTRLNGLYNRVLSLLSLPSSPHPFRDMPLHQRAQFECLRSMANHRPPLSTSREGYRAIARVQLANSKTAQERDWAELKSKSWPPWKQDRTGLDADKDFEYGTSRALEAIQRGIEAGYASRGWERAAKVLSGWDIDGSPTIQTRAILLHRDVVSPSYGDASSNDSMLWQMRIKATRTLPEAWAAFLEWKERQLQPHALVYHAMLAKIAADAKRTRAEQHNGRRVPPSRSQALPGDGLETTEAPASDSEGIYVPEPAPTFDELAEEMYHAGIVPTNSRLLVLLIQNANSVEGLMKYLHWATQKDDRLTNLLDEQPSDENLDQVDVRVFTAYIIALCRAATGDLRRSMSTLRTPFQTALRLLFTYAPRHLGAWHAVSHCLATGSSIRELTRDANISREQYVYRWHLMQALYKQMEKKEIAISTPTILAMCRCLENAARSSRATLEHSKPISAGEDSEKSVSIQADEAAKVIASGSSYIRDRFQEIFPPLEALTKSQVNQFVASRAPEPQDFMAQSQEELDVLHLGSPDLSLIHAYIRVQGTLDAWQELLTSAQWMVANRRAINKCVEDSAAGQTMLRKCLVALRVFAEGHADYSVMSPDHEVKSGARPKKRRMLQRLVESVEGWGGWPSDGECLRYLEAENPKKQKES